MVAVAPPPVGPVVRGLAHQAPRPASLLARILGVMGGAATAPVRIRHLQGKQVPILPFWVAKVAARPPLALSVPAVLGLRPGSWVAVTLRHELTDQDRALVVFHVRRAVHGRYGVLPTGTRLLAHEDGVRSGHVQFRISEAVFPNGLHIPFSAVVFARDRSLGLRGYALGHRRKTVVAAFARSVVEGADAAIGALSAQSSVTSAALGQVGTSTVNAASRWHLPRRILYVPAQNAYVQTQKGT